MTRFAADYVIVGSGLTGAVIARALADAGREVLVLERRSHVGGNVHDHQHASGIWVHSYGPHYFRTSNLELWEYVRRFAKFYPFEARLQSLVDGRYENWPIAEEYIHRRIGCDWKPEFEGTPTNFEEASLAMMPRLVYEKFVKGYTEKQWGVAPRNLSVHLARRFDVRRDNEPRLMRHAYQGLPVGGYHRLMQRMLAGIDCELNVDYLAIRREVEARRLLVFTGPIDAYYDFDLGRLHYRGQQRQHEYLPHESYVLPCSQVNNPDPASGPHIRTLEWKHMLQPHEAAAVQGTLLTRETTYSPSDPDHYEYPFPDDANAQLYARYRQRANSDSKLLVCGRLGDYRYYDMDQAIARARLLADRLLQGSPTLV